MKKNGLTIAQCFTFFHGMRGDHYGFVIFSCESQDAIPKKSFSPNIHTGCWFLQPTKVRSLILSLVYLTSINIIDGFPMSEIAVDSLRLFPPEYCFTGRSAHRVNPRRFNKHSTIYSHKFQIRSNEAFLDDLRMEYSFV